MTEAGVSQVQGQPGLHRQDLVTKTERKKIGGREEGEDKIL
jgi:hypothetical protein